MKRRVYIIIGVVLYAAFSSYQFYKADYSDQGIMEHVIHREGYSLSLQQQNIPIELWIQPEWIAFGKDERKEPNVILLEQHGTKIILSDVWNRGNDIYFSFTTSYDLGYKGGQFLANFLANDNGTFTSGTGEIVLTDKSGQRIPTGQYGEGPNSDFSFGVNPKDQALIGEGIKVQYSGFYFYHYQKL
ncbi:hypothetical protein [Paenibacillus koleovorans]|uniref:hypothetical protein n=1 Tax=Paenibacillus koleovorans TaxID=121608 RepID=UPI000FD839FF|nr:hypothetical protein [Paenibacillus koleovorans]